MTHTSFRVTLLATLFLLLKSSYAQNVGIGTTAPATRLDVAGGNNFDLVNSEGDFRIGNSSYRMKFGVALGGGGAGAASIMQYGQTGGYNVLALGAQGNYMLYLNGSTNRTGIGTNVPATDFEIRSSSGVAAPQLGITQNNVADYSRIRMRNTTNLY